MQTIRVYSKNAAYQKFEVLKNNRQKRFRYGEFLVEGVRSLNTARKHGWHINAFLYSPEKPLSDWAKEMLQNVAVRTHYQLSLPLLRELSGKEDESELMAVIAMRETRPEEIPLSEVPLLALFDRPSNRGNLGTILRSCDALGVDGLILTGHGVDPYDPEVVVAGMGSWFKVPFCYLPETSQVEKYIAALKEKYPDLQVIGTTAHREHPIDSLDLTGPVMFMIGNETDGLCRAFKEKCDILTTIPMVAESQASSFNVGCAATVMFYEADRQRRNKNRGE